MDDEVDIVNLVRIILEGEGYKVSAAFDGEEAIVKAEAELPDLILLDVVMPKKTGLEACRILKSQNKTRMIPIVMFTVLGRDVDRKLSLEVGADAHFTKPFEPEDLLKTVREIIEKYRKRRFSLSIGLEHDDIRGRKILLEYDPESPYERCVRDYVLEAKANGERPVVITRVGSPVYEAVKDEEGIEIVSLEESLILSPVIERHRDMQVALTFDSLTELTLSLGFTRAYNFLREALRGISEKRITALFLLNSDAHQPSETNNFRSLFNNQLGYDREGMKKIKNDVRADGL